MRAWIWIAVMVMASAGGCREAACADELLELTGRCRQAMCAVACGEHAVCDYTVDPDVCFCAPGYAGDPCTWVEPEPSELCTSTAAAVGDPCFRNKPDAIWDGNVQPTAPGSNPASTADDGEGQLRPRAVCDGDSLTQTIQMPPYEASEPLVAEVTYQAAGVHGLAVGFDQTWTRLPPTGEAWETETFCLGEAAYGRGPTGGPIVLRLSASERLEDCEGVGSPQGTISVASFAIRRPREEEACPGPAPVLNPQANPTQRGWIFEADGSGTAAGMVSDAGNQGTSGARIFRGEGATGRPSMRTQVFVPRATTKASPALVFWWQGDNQRLFEVTIGTYVGVDDDPGRRLATLVGQGGDGTAIYCLPPWTHGAVVDLAFALVDDGNPAEVALAVDNVGIVTQEKCGDSTGLLDPSFDSATATVPIPWAGTFLDSAAEQLVMREGELAFGGQGGALELNYDRLGASMGMETYVLVPNVEGDGNPAVAFYTNAPADPSARVEWVLGRSEVLRCDLPTGTDWQRNEVCLPREWAGRWYRVQVKVTPFEDTTDTPIPRERVLLDEFELVESTSCLSTCP